EELGLPRRPATPSAGPIVIATTDALAIDPGAIFTRQDGIKYTATAGAVISQAGNLSVAVDAIANGSAGNSIAGTPLDITSGASGPGLDTATAEVDTAGIVAGLDVEDDETYRQRILFRKRNPPNGGSAADYVMWGTQVPGVTRVFVERLFNGAGTVRVFPLMDNIYPNGIPQAADIARVAGFIDTVQPAGAIVTVAAPIASPIDVSVGGLLPFTTDVQEAIKLELAAMFLAYSRVAGIDGAISQLPYLASPTSFSRSWIWQAVANAAGEARCSVNGPSADPVIAQGRIATLGALNFAAN
ncbi:MAG: baseplate J/gp47 family protein, partial [Bradyrhizobium sp.]